MNHDLSLTVSEANRLLRLVAIHAAADIDLVLRHHNYPEELLDTSYRVILKEAALQLNKAVAASNDALDREAFRA